MEVDVVVVGSGAAAMAAAVAAACGGLKVLVAEKDARFGGTSAISGGVAWIPDNPHIAETGHVSGEYDSRDRAMRYFKSLVGSDRMRPDVMEAFYDNGRKMVEFFEKSTHVQFEATTYPDYKAHLDGGMSIGRSISAKPYHGSQMGRRLFDQLRPPMREMCIAGSMMVDGTDVNHLMNMGRSLHSFSHATCRFLTFLQERVRYGRGARLVMGNALLGRLLKSADDVGVILWRNTAATCLVKRDGRIVGIVLDRQGKTIEVAVRRGVVLGTGGFAHDEELKRKLIPYPDQHESICPDANTGDGLHMAIQAGGRLGGNTFHNFLGTQVAIMRDRQGRIISKTPFMRRDRNKPGYILVDHNGQRFVNEAWPYNDVAHAMNQNAASVPSYLICDHVRLRRYGLGLVRPGPGWARPLGAYLRSGHLFRAKTLDRLAAKLGVDASGLARTVAKMNGYAQTGVDLEFCKGETTYDRWQGDPEVKPNSSLGPIIHGPFYAIKLWPGNMGTFCGLMTDASARVLGDDDVPIPGLYAVGCDMHPVFTGSYPGGGGSIGPGMTFGYIAGRDLVVGENLRDPVADALPLPSTVAAWPTPSPA